MQMNQSVCRSACVLVLALVVVVPQGMSQDRLPVLPPLIRLDSEAGESMLEESEHRKNFVKLAMHFVTQENLAYCGVASSAMALNTIDVPRPVSPNHGQFRLFTQDNLFDAGFGKTIAASTVRRQGMTLDELGNGLSEFDTRIETAHANDSSLAEFRNRLKGSLNMRSTVVLINYSRKELGQDGGGHISPIAAYHAPSDSALILDVSRYKYPPVWAKVDLIWKAMDTVDSASSKSRGFVIVASK